MRACPGGRLRCESEGTDERSLQFELAVLNEFFQGLAVGAGHGGFFKLGVGDASVGLRPLRHRLRVVFVNPEGDAVPCDPVGHLEQDRGRRCFGGFWQGGEFPKASASIPRFLFEDHAFGTLDEDDALGDVGEFGAWLLDGEVGGILGAAVRLNGAGLAVGGAGSAECLSQLHEGGI